MISNILLDFLYSLEEIYRALGPWELIQYLGVFIYELVEFICRFLYFTDWHEHAIPFISRS